MFKPLFLIASLFLLILAKAVDSADFSIESIKRGHPRILASEADFDSIRKADWDKLGIRYMEFLRYTGKAMLTVPPVKHQLSGMRLLSESRKFLKRVSTWSLLYKIDGDVSMRDRAIQEMEADNWIAEDDRLRTLPMLAL